LMRHRAERLLPINPKKQSPAMPGFASIKLRLRDQNGILHFTEAVCAVKPERPSTS
jgi:hypothetical protein